MEPPVGSTPDSSALHDERIGVIGRGARAGATTIAGQIAKLAIQMVALVVLSRLLPAGDFGLIAMTSVFISLGALIRDFGMPTAALQARSLTPQQASNLFWINTSLGLLGAAAITLATPLIAGFYGDTRLETLLPFMSIALILGGLSSQFQIRLARQLRAGAIAIADVTAQCLGLLVAILGAMQGLGYWALGWQAVSTAGGLLVFLVAAARWLPALPRRGSDTFALFSTGLNYGAAQMLTYAASNVDTLLIGARWGSVVVGYYSRAFQLLSLPVQSLLAPLTNVVIPTVHRARSGGIPIDHSLLRVQFAVGGATIWLFSVAIAGAPWLIPLLLGDGWIPAVTLFQILSIGGAFQCLSFVSYWGFMAYEKSRQLLYYNLVTKSATIAAVAIAVPFGVEVVAWTYSACLAVSWPVNLAWLSRSAGQASMKYFFNGLRLLAPAALGVATVQAVVTWSEWPRDVLTAGALATLVCSTVYVLGVLVTPGGMGEARQAWRVARAVISR